MNPIIPDGGGNVHFESHMILRRTAAVGDALCATIVAKKLIQRGFKVAYQAHPGVHCVLRRFELPLMIGEPNGFCHIDLDNTYERDPNRRVKHFHQMFLEAANLQLAARGLNLGPALNCKPKMVLAPHEKLAGINRLREYPRPWVFICPRSNTYNVRQVTDGIWEEIAANVKGTKFWLGNHGPAPKNVVDLGVRHLDNLIVWLSAADLLLTVDTGPMHIAAAMNVPIVAIDQSSSPTLHLNDQNDYVTVAPAGLDCLNCQQNVCPKNHHFPPCQLVSPGLVSDWANARLRSKFNDDVSAVVAVYRPEVAVLNRCLDSIVNQVSEVIVVRDTFGRFPEGARAHAKIRYVTSPESDIGYGRKMLYGTRFTNGKWILHCNDDAYLEPDCVQRLVGAIKPDTGIVTPILRYPSDRTIYHAGKIRNPGMRGWGHIDHRKHLPTFTTITELENTCGCVILIRRQAFYEVDGFDQEFYVYAEDDDLSLKIRQAGYKILLQPAALGWHEEHHSTKKTEGIVDKMNISNAIFGRKWSWWFDKNINTVPGTF